MFIKRAVDWKAIGETLLTPEVLGAIIGGVGAPLATYLVRRKKEMPAWRRAAELLGAGALGAGAGAGIGYGAKKGLLALLMRQYEKELERVIAEAETIGFEQGRRAAEARRAADEEAAKRYAEAFAKEEELRRVERENYDKFRHLMRSWRWLTDEEIDKAIEQQPLGPDVPVKDLRRYLWRWRMYERPPWRDQHQQWWEQQQ